jgi:hypothetical protein
MAGFRSGPARGPPPPEKYGERVELAPAVARLVSERRWCGVSYFPRKCQPYRHYALAGSDYCLQHEPARREEVVAIVTAARTAIGRDEEEQAYG